jgi:hypothetical protein
MESLRKKTSAGLIQLKLNSYGYLRRGSLAIGQPRRIFPLFYGVHSGLPEKQRTI